MAKTSAAPQHLGYLDGLRALAALFVVIHHALLQVHLEQHPLTGLAGAVVAPFYQGRYAVDLFIVLSGFCLMLPVVNGDGTLRRGARNFFQRRAWRILPPYYLATAFSLLLIGLFIGRKTGTHWDVSLPVTAKSVVTHLLLVQDAFGEDATINHAFWSIAVEWRIYFLFPLLVLGWRRIGALKTTLIAVVSSYALYLLGSRLLGSSLSAHYIGLFAMGMLAATIAFGGTLPRLRSLPWGWITALLAVAVVVLSVARIWRGDTLPIHLRGYVMGALSLSVLVLTARGGDHWLHRALSGRPLVFVGTFAYSIYLIHAPLLQLFWQYPLAPLQTNPPLMFAVLAGAGTPVIVGLSYLFFLACERPFLRKRTRESSETLATKAALEPAP